MSKLLFAAAGAWIAVSGVALAQNDPPIDPGKIVNDVGADIAARTDWFGKAVGNIVDPDEEPPPPKPVSAPHHHHHQAQ